MLFSIKLVKVKQVWLARILGVEAFEDGGSIYKEAGRMILSRSYELKHINILLYTGGDSRSVETPGPGAFKTAHCFRYTSARPPRLPILKRGEKGPCPNAILLPRLKPGAGVSYFKRPRVPTAIALAGKLRPSLP